MKYPGAFIKILADDLKMYLPIVGLDDCYKPQNALDKVHHLCEKGKLLINAEKCSIVPFTKKVSPILYSYTTDNKVLLKKETIRDLGLLDSKLSFSFNTYTIISDAIQMLGFMRSCKSFSNVATSKFWFNSLVRSKLDYKSVIWSPLLWKTK